MAASPKNTSLQAPAADAADSIVIRPIRRSDLIVAEDFYEDLSFDRKRNRFLGGVSNLSMEELDRLCDVDYHDSMAFGAFFYNGQYWSDIGMVRYALDSTNGAHEMAVVLADGVDVQDIGCRLLTHLFEYAQVHGVKRLYSIEFRDNMDMKVLAKPMGMSCEIDPDDIHQLIYSIEF